MVFLLAAGSHPSLYYEILKRHIAKTKQNIQKECLKELHALKICLIFHLEGKILLRGLFYCRIHSKISRYILQEFNQQREGYKTS